MTTGTENGGDLSVLKGGAVGRWYKCRLALEATREMALVGKPTGHDDFDQRHIRQSHAGFWVMPPDQSARIPASVSVPPSVKEVAAKIRTAGISGFPDVRLQYRLTPVANSTL